MPDARGLAWRALRTARNWFRPGVPAHLQSRFRQLDTATFEELKAVLVRHVVEQHQRVPDENEEEFQNHLTRRLEMNRSQVIPWLDDVRPLAGASILEIGCGTGSSTVALAEQCARVTAVDAHEPPIAVARQRLRLYGLDARFIAVNADQVHLKLAGERFDVVIFYASLEHMLYTERLAAIRGTWDLLPPGGLWCVVEAPKRLWYYDHHSAHMNYFLWLPDELAVPYLRFSPRADVRDLFRRPAAAGAAPGPADLETLLRLGRGVSYHEFELALGPLAGLNVVSHLAGYQRRRDKAIWLQWRPSRAARFESLLAAISPEVPRAFLQPELNLVLRKGG
jgi:2-polyprenyl-3-methyl-5-hydroxy-6-metoxy-1,4-benzoquinol methylase